MSTLTSSSTDAEIEAAYIDNASYAEDGSVTKCKAFITAVRILMLRLATESAQGNNRLRQDENLRQFRAEMQAANDWLNGQQSVANGGSGAIGASFQGFRD